MSVDYNTWITWSCGFEVAFPDILSFLQINFTPGPWNSTINEADACFFPLWSMKPTWSNFPFSWQKQLQWCHLDLSLLWSGLSGFCLIFSQDIISTTMLMTSSWEDLKGRMLYRLDVHARHKNKNIVACHLSQVFSKSKACTCQDIPCGQAAASLPPYPPPEEESRLLGHSGFWRQHIPLADVLLWPIYWVIWKEKAL